MASLRIALLYFDGCPLAPLARANLMDAIRTVSAFVRVSFEEVNLDNPGIPPHLQRWGSPTILLNGRDLFGGAQGEARSCRIYGDGGDVPTTLDIIEAMAHGAGRHFTKRADG